METKSNESHHRLFKCQLFQGNQYLLATILKVEGEAYKFNCKACNKELFFENLISHLSSKGHKKTTKPNIIAAAINHILTQSSDGISDTNIKNINDKNMEIESSDPKESQTTIQNFHSRQVMDQSDELIFLNEDEIDVPQNDNTSFENLFSTNGVRIDKEIYFRFQIMSFILQNNLPFSSSRKIVDLIKEIIITHSFTKLQTYTMNKNHATKIARNCIAPYLKQKRLEDLNKSPFSIAVDEGTAKGNVTYLAISARYFANEEDVTTTTKLLGLIEMATSSTGETLYTLIRNFLFSGNEGLERKENFIGISSDHASNLISGKEPGLLTD